MYLRITNTCSVLQSIINAHFHFRKFHLTFNNSMRRVTSKFSTGDSESDFYKENIDPPQIDQQPYSNFLGIESDEGVIFIDPNESSKNDLHQSVQLTDAKKTFKEKYYRTSFGVIRRDSDNNHNFHGQFENKVDFTFPHKSTDNSEVSSEFYKLKSNALGILYEDPIDKSKSHLNNSILSDKPLTHNLHTVSCIGENENKTCNLKEDTQEMGYIDECFFGNLVEKNILNENTVSNTSPVEELNYLDKAFFGHETLTKNPLPHSKMYSSENCIPCGETFFHEAKLKEDISNQSTSPVEELDKKSFEHSKNISHDEMNTYRNYLPDDELYLDENKSLHFSFPDNGNDISAVNDVKCFTRKVKPGFLNDSNFHASSKTTCDGKDIHVSRVPFKNKLKISNFNNSDCLQFDNFQQAKKENFVQKNQTNKNLFKHDVGFDVLLNDKQLGEPVNEKYSNSNVQSLDTKSNFPCDEEVSSIEDAQFFSKKTSSRKDIVEKSAESEQITTAQEFVEKLRRERERETSVMKDVTASNGEKLDSKGFRILKNQVPDFSYCSRDEIITILKDSILYSDDDLLVLNKPYSLVIHDSKTTRSPCLSELLDDLAKYIDRKRTDPKLFTVHRLDKDTTGCLLLAKNEATAESIKSLFSQRKIIKKYLILTSRIPDPLQGIIDIPVTEGSIGNKKRMVLQPQLPKDVAYRNHSKGGKQAVTHYKVISLSGNAALVEATPETGIKHQIRVHFGFGLSCPILGDHKYSHLDKLAPQKLPSDLLQKLHVRQSKVRHIPMHLHAQSVTIPGYLNGRNLYVTAPLPAHMIANLKRLKFKKKNKLTL